MSKISLTASMRNNLLSLQNISRQVSLTQNRLATGQKVNSAIDNPSSFYSASSLNNRAKDLDNLLDAMSQATSTIKAATTALETATTFLEQASAVATQALESAIPAKEYFEELVGENGAVVSTAQELKDAVAAGKETICIYGKIDYFENETVKLKDGQNLVGTEYFTGYTGKEKFSQINFAGNQNNAILCWQTNNIISDLSINYNSSSEQADGAIWGLSSNIIISNVDISFSSNYDGDVFPAAIRSKYGSNVRLQGNININTKSIYACAIGAEGGANININENSVVNINSGVSSVSSTLQSAFLIYKNSRLNIGGTVNAQSPSLLYLPISPHNQNTVVIESTAKINTKNTSHIFRTLPDNNIFIERGATIEMQDNEGSCSVVSKGDIFDNNTNASLTYTSTHFANSSKYTLTESTIDWDNWQAVEDKEKDTSTEDAGKQYSEILSQYDNLINDASYKGINLLKQDSLKVNFNENGNSNLSVNGKDMSSGTLGFETKSWASQSDIVKSVKELTAALNSIRSYDAELGNNYSIITSRQNFTESLINILTEGADKLTLADMNEESANMLALQTRQQLAINALSLASQASQSVLKLF